MKQSLPISLLIIAAFCSLFCSCTSEGERQHMAQIIAEADSLNRNYIPLTSDSLLIGACEFYDRHGSPNERMKAHYLLGCVYRDMGEAPRAIESYQDAVACADTTDSDCDFQKLGCIYSQMGDVFHRQLLLLNEMNARRQALKYFNQIGRTFNIGFELRFIAGIYALENKVDSAELIFKNAVDILEKNNYCQEALQISTLLMHLYSNQPNQKMQLKQLIDKYESESSLFDESRNLPPFARQFFYYKGKYYEFANQLDSAEFYYHKIYRPNMKSAQKDPMYRGLLSVFQTRNQSDSIAKYAKLLCEANDSSIAIKDQDLTAQVAASYNYAHYQKQSLDSEKKANNRLQLSIVLLILAFAATVLAAFFRYRYVVSQKEKQRTLEKLMANHAQALNLYEEKLQQLQALDENHQETIDLICQELEKVQKENVSVKLANAKSRHLIEKLNSQYEEKKQQLTSELNSQIDKVEQLERQLRLNEYKKNSIHFMNLGIVQRVKIYAENSSKQLPTADLQLLIEATKDCFPDLISDLNEAPGLSTLATNVCVLVFMNLPSKSITHLLNLSSQQVANLKRDINLALFNDDTATSLHNNLTSRYKLFSV